jgi:hypothetical protein
MAIIMEKKKKKVQEVDEFGNFFRKFQGCMVNKGGGRIIYSTPKAFHH